MIGIMFLKRSDRLKERLRKIGARCWTRQCTWPQRTRLRVVEYRDGQGDDKSPGKWLDHAFKVIAPRFVSSELAPKVITALWTMNAERGRKPSTLPEARQDQGIRDFIAIRSF